MFAALFAATILALTAALLFFLFVRLSLPGRQGAGDGDEFSIRKYQPLSRLLLDRDLAFLSAQPGYKPELGRKLRRARRKVVRMYLRSLSRDFDRCYLAAKLALLDSPEDRPDLASELLKQRLMFRYALAIAYGRLALDAAGLGSFQPRPLWSAVQSIGGRLQMLSAEARALQA